MSQSDCSFGQQQTPTSKERCSRRWKLAYRQNQQPLLQASPTVRQNAIASDLFP